LIEIKNIRNIVRKWLKEGLAEDLTYHNFNHTCNVVKNALAIAEAELITSNQDLVLLETAAWLHDAGFINTYKNHEEEGCKIARKMLPEWGASDNEVESICELIQATKVPQNPKNILSQILCDADLFYLGSSSFYEISERLKNEWLAYGIIQDVDDFHDKQLQFLSAHRYYTPTARKLREPGKANILNELRATVKIGIRK
jgi:uncharacterized protein